MNPKQVSHLFPVLLEHGKEGLVLIDCDNAALIDCNSLKELTRVLLPDCLNFQVFNRSHSVDNQVVIIAFQSNDKSGVLYRLVVHKNILLLDEYRLLFPSES